MASKQEVETYLKELKVKMEIFGKHVKKNEVYIKVSMGTENSGAVCISFHIAKHAMNYPIKK